MNDSRIIKGRVVHVIECGECDGQGETEFCLCAGPCWKHCPTFRMRQCRACTGVGETYDSDCSCEDCEVLMAKLSERDTTPLPPFFVGVA
jgi:hypothetical protein